MKVVKVERKKVRKVYFEKDLNAGLAWEWEKGCEDE